MTGKKKKKPSAGFLNGAAEPPPRHCRDKGGETVEGSSAVALILPPLSLSPFRRSEVSPLYRVIDCFVRKWGTRASHELILLVF